MGDKIRETRKAVALTQEQASKFCGVPLRTWSNWERGVNTPPDYVENLICEKLLTYKN